MHALVAINKQFRDVSLRFLRAFCTFVATFILFTLLSACANLNLDKQDAVQSKPHQDQNIEDEQTLPNLALSEDVLADLLEANIASYNKQWSQSADAFLKAAKQSKDPRLASYAAALAMEVGDAELALEAATLWASSSEQRDKVLPALIWAQLAADRVPQALQSIEELLEPNLLQEFERALPLIARQPNKQASLELMQLLLARYPDETQIKLYAANMANNAKQSELAEQWVDEVLKVEPNNEMATQFKLQSLSGDDNSEQRRALLLDYVERNPKSATMMLALASEYSREQEYERAYQWIEKSLKSDSDNIPTLNMAAALADELGLEDESQAYYKRIVKLEPSNDAARWALARLALENEDYKRAKNYYGDITNEQYWFSAQLQIARMEYRLNGLTSAMRTLDKLAPRSMQEYLDHALARHYLLLDEQQYEDALGYINETLVLLPESIELLFARGLVSAEVNDVDAAEADFRKIIELEPDNANALNALGYTLADLTDRFEEARSLIEKALEMEPKAAHILDSMGWVLYRQNELQDALIYLLKAYAIDQDAEIAAHLGEVYWELGEQDTATKIWQAGFEAEANNPALVRTLERYNISFPAPN